MKECKYCKENMKENAVFCPHCKKKQNYDREKKIGMIAGGFIITILIIIGLIKIINDSNKNKQNQAVGELASLFLEEYYNGAVSLEKLGNCLEDYWRSSIYDGKYNNDINEAIRSYKNDYSTEILLVKESYNLFATGYETFNVVKCYNEKCNELKMEINEAYDLYSQLYDLVVNPSGNYLEYSEKFSKYDTEVAKKYKKLSRLINVYDK